MIHKSLTKSRVLKLFILFSSLSFLLLKLLFINNPLMFYDEGSYILEGARYAGIKPNVEYFYARPGYDIILGIFRFVISNSINSARAANLLFWVATGGLGFIYIRRLYSSSVAWLFVWAYAALPLLNYLSMVILPDVCATFFSFWATLLILEHAHNLERLKNSLLLGLSLSLFCVVGGYRYIIVIAVLLFFIILKFYLYPTNRARQLLAFLFPFTLIIYVFQQNMSFLTQTWALIVGQPGMRGSVPLISPDLLFYPFIFCIFFLPFIILLPEMTRNFLSGLYSKNFFISKLESRFISLLVLAPFISHSLISMRAPRVLTPILPSFALLVALAIVKKSDKFRLFFMPTASLICFGISWAIISDMGWSGRKELAYEVGKLKGMVSDSSGNRLTIVESSSLDWQQTEIAADWSCGWNKNVCDATYLVRRCDYDVIGIKKIIGKQISECFSLNLVFPASLLMTLESADQGNFSTFAFLNSGNFFKATVHKFSIFKVN